MPYSAGNNSVLPCTTSTIPVALDAEVFKNESKCASMLQIYYQTFNNSSEVKSVLVQCILKRLPERLDGPFYKQLMLAPDTQNKQFIHCGCLYSAIISCLCSHFAVVTVFEVFLNQGSHKILAFDPWMGLLMCPFFISDTESDYLLCFQ